MWEVDLVFSDHLILKQKFLLKILFPQTLLNDLEEEKKTQKRKVETEKSKVSTRKFPWKTYTYAVFQEVMRKLFNHLFTHKWIFRVSGSMQKVGCSRWVWCRCAHTSCPVPSVPGAMLAVCRTPEGRGLHLEGKAGWGLTSVPGRESGFIPGLWGEKAWPIPKLKEASEPRVQNRDVW